MTIADLIKYIDFLKERTQMLRQKVSQAESVKSTQKVVAINEASGTKVVEDTAPTYSVADLTSEYDKTAKELRLAQQTLERVNHTTDVSFTAQY
jgi:vacuolar-type H+-ATPase subunit I/STV1